jgi:flagellar motility protein MotE (MotC chaperone)
MKRRFRPRLLMLTAIAATLSVVANGVGAVTAATAPPATRLGVAIQKDVSAVEAAAAQRSRALELREQAAKATEERLKAEIGERDAAATKAGGPDATEPGEQYDSLARVYQAMKPARAAAIFEQLEMDVQMQVAKRMRDRSTAMILAAMSPRGAARLSMALARKDMKAMPQPGPTPPPPAATASAASTPAPVTGPPKPAAATATK